MNSNQYDPYNSSRNGQNDQYTYQQYQSYDPDTQKKEKRKKKRFMVQVLALILAVLLTGGIVIGMVSRDKQGVQQKDATEMLAENETTSDLSVQVATSPVTYQGDTSLTDVSQVVKNVSPAIVAITCDIVQEYEYHGRVYRQEGRGAGSGIIIGQNSSEVLIVTNNHVVEDATSMEVTFGDDETVEAAVKGASSNYDLAVVSVKMEDIPEETLSYVRIATLGDSDTLEVGEMAIAYGNALGYGQTTTVGYISALNRMVSNEDFSMELIQTDAAINPGNSGGALLNCRGEVIGINSAKYSDTDVEGMGFAIPISKAIPIITQLMNDEVPEEHRAYLGIVPYDVNEIYAERFRMPLGVYVSEVKKASPADRAGLQVGDIIVSMEGQEISTGQELSNVLSRLVPGDQVQVTFYRLSGGEYREQTVKVTLGEQPNEE